MLVGRRVLIVEDEPLIADEQQAVLERARAIVLRKVDTEAAALAYLMQERADVVVLDWNLRGTHPLMLADYLGSQAVPFVIVTGYGRESLPSELRNCAFVQKPYRRAELLAGLSAALQQEPLSLGRL
jgi:DNA-binding response OmpR family regulator